MAQPTLQQIAAEAAKKEAAAANEPEVTPAPKTKAKRKQGVLVRFNCSTIVHMIPDEQYEKEKESLLKMRYENFKDYQQRLAAGSPFEHKNFKAGDTATIPEWYYNCYKDQMASISVSSDRYYNEQGDRIPFLGNKAVQYGHIQKEDQTMQKVPRFTKIDQPTEEAA